MAPMLIKKLQKNQSVPSALKLRLSWEHTPLAYLLEVVTPQALSLIHVKGDSSVA